MVQSNGLIHEIVTNNLMIQLLGYHSNQYMSHFYDFEILKHFRSKNWIEFYFNYISFLQDDISTYVIMKYEELSLYNKNGKILKGNFTIYKESYVKEKNLWDEIYIVFGSTNLDELVNPANELQDYSDHFSL